MLVVRAPVCSLMCVGSGVGRGAIAGWDDPGERDATEHIRMLRIPDSALALAGGPARANAEF